MNELNEGSLNEMFGNIIGKQILKSRKKHGLTQEQAAERIGCSTEHLGRIERGEQKPKGLLLSLILLRLDVRSDDYLKELNEALEQYEQRH